MPKKNLPALRKSSALLTKDKTTASQFTLIADLIIQDGNTGKQQTARFVSAPQNGPIPANWQHAVQQMGAHALIDQAMGPCLHHLARGPVQLIEGMREYQPLPSHLLDKNKPYKESDSTMNEIIKINQDNWNGEAVQTVNARELHKFLESKREFATWIKDRIEKYGFIEGQDFLTILSKTSNGRPSKEYHLTLDMAKELAMVENNDKGREARRYFIECEKRALQGSQFQIPQTLPDALRLAADQADQIAVLAPKAEALDQLGAADGSLSLREAAKAADWPEQKFIKQLEARGIIFKNGIQKNWQGYAQKRKAGWLEHRVTTKTHPNGEERVYCQVLITAKGLAKITELLGPYNPEHQAKAA